MYNANADILGVTPRDVTAAEALLPDDPQARDPRRWLDVAGAVNLRDIGGYRTADGRSVRWGQYLRGGALNALAPAGVAQLQQLGVPTVYDLRSVQEAHEMPDQLPAGSARRHRPIVDPRRMNRLRTLARLLAYRWIAGDLLLDAYTKVVLDRNAATIGEIMTTLADPASRPLLVHCTAGKDRTGVVSALLLSVLGVPDATVCADYALSNRYYTTFVAQMQHNVALLRRVGITAEMVQPMLLAQPTTIQGLLDYVRARYGSIERYLIDKAGVATDVPATLRAELLTAAA